MSQSVPAHAVEIATSADQCTIAADGYTASEHDHVFTRGTPRIPSPKITVTGEGSGIWVAEDAYLHVDAEIKGNNSGVIVGPKCRLRRLTVKIDGDNCWIIFGAESTTESATVLASPEDQHVVFGDDCMLSSGVIVRTDDGHSVFDRNTRERLGLPSSVNIGAHVWLGNAARINRGVTIGAGTVIGQQSIVSGTLEGHSTYAGIPARQLRKDVAWSRTRDYDDIPAFGR